MAPSPLRFAAGTRGRTKLGCKSSIVHLALTSQTSGAHQTGAGDPKGYAGVKILLTQTTSVRPVGPDICFLISLKQLDQSLSTSLPTHSRLQGSGDLNEAPYRWKFSPSPSLGHSEQKVWLRLRQYVRGRQAGGATTLCRKGPPRPCAFPLVGSKVRARWQICFLSLESNATWRQLMFL